MTRRARRRVEAAAALLAFPAAVALTVIAISLPAGSAGARPSAVDRSSPQPSAAVTVSLAGGDPVRTYAIADALASEGYDLVSVTGDAPGNSLSAGTVVVYYERGRMPAAARLADLLGGGTIRLDQVLEPSSDLTVILGKDPQRS